MTRQRIRGGLAGLIVVAPVIGCATTRPDSTGQAFAPAPEMTTEVPHNEDLPPKRAAKVCLAAGAELAKKGYPQDAIPQYEKARQLDPQSAGVARRLAVLYDLQGDDSRAAAEYKRA